MNMLSRIMLTEQTSGLPGGLRACWDVGWTLRGNVRKVCNSTFALSNSARRRDPWKQFKSISLYCDYCNHTSAVTPSSWVRRASNSSRSPASSSKVIPRPCPVICRIDSENCLMHWCQLSSLGGMRSQSFGWELFDNHLQIFNCNGMLYKFTQYIKHIGLHLTMK